MGNVRVIEVKESVFAENGRVSQEIRSSLKEQGTFFINVMSSPGSGKTTMLSKLINLMKNDYKIGVMDVDIETDMDAKKVSDTTGISSLQIHNGGLCHIDADMVSRALEHYDTTGLDILILENIGNLVCPAEFDTGAHKNVMILSVPEGDDKPLKYPLMFSVSDVILINKIDTLEYFDFDLTKVKERIIKLNPNAVIFPISAKTGEGMGELINWIAGEVKR